MKNIRYREYGKLLIELEGKVEIVCPRYKTKDEIDTKKIVNHLHEIEH